LFPLFKKSNGRRRILGAMDSGKERIYEEKLCDDGDVLQDFDA
jgi:hypothetical protein